MSSAVLLLGGAYRKAPADAGKGEEDDAAAAVMAAIESCLRDGGPTTPDLGGNAGTETVGKAIAAAI